MTDDKVYYPQTIADTPLPNQVTGDASFSSSQSGANQVYGPETIKEQPVPVLKIATELLSSSLNTRSQRILAEFQFTEMGALQIGKYVNGVSGDIRISPNGLVGRNDAGMTTFAIDATTGDVVFAGTIQAGTLIAGAVAVGGNNIVIDGENQRITMTDPATGLVRLVIGNV